MGTIIYDASIVYVEHPWSEVSPDAVAYPVAARRIYAERLKVDICHTPARRGPCACGVYELRPMTVGAVPAPIAKPRRRRESPLWAIVFGIEVLVILGLLAHATASRVEIAWRDPANILIVPSR